MSNVRRQLDASINAADAELCNDARMKVDAAPLADVDGAEVTFPAAIARRLAEMAEEALAARNALPPHQIGPRGRVRRAGLDDHGDYSANIVFEGEEDLRAAGALLFRAVSIEPIFDAGEPANESSPGRGVASTQETPS